MSIKRFLALTLAVLMFASSALAWGDKSNADAYKDAVELLQDNKYAEAAAAFADIGNYEDAAQLAMYCYAIAAGESGFYSAAVTNLQSLGAFRDSALLAIYYAGRSYEEAEQYETAAERFAGMTFYRDVATRLASYPEKINARDYARADAAEQAGKLETALSGFKALGSYSDSAARAAAVQEKINARDYAAADQAEQNNQLETALSGFTALGSYSDSPARAAAVQIKINERDEAAAEAARVAAYAAADQAEQNNQLETALSGFTALGSYSDSPARAAAVQTKINERDAAAAEAARAAAYAAADQAEQNEDYAAAYSGFAALGDYLDSAERAAAIQDKGIYAQAMQYALAGNFAKAYSLFTTLSERDYEDSARKAYVTSVTTFATVKNQGDGIAVFQFHDQWGIINVTANTIVSPQWDSIDRFNTLDLAKVKKGDKYGYINAQGEVVIACEWHSVSDFNALGLAKVKKEDKYGYVNAQGEIVIACDWQSISDFNSLGLAKVNKGDKYGYVNTQGEVVIACDWYAVSGFNGTLCTVTKKEGKNYLFGLADSTGAIISEAQWRTLGASVNGTWDSSNNSPDTKLPSFSDGKIKVQNKQGLWGFIDENGALVGEVVWSSISSFSGGLAVACKDKKYGFIDNDGNIIIDPKYDEVYLFSEGLAAVRTGEYWQYINQNDEIIIQPLYTSVYSFTGGKADVFLPGTGWQIIDKTGALLYFIDNQIVADYARATQLMNSGNYVEAQNIFLSLTSYKDSMALAKECLYLQAGALNVAGKYTEAYALYATISGYKDVDSLVQTDHNLAAAAVVEAFTKVGNIVTYGHYEQDNNTSNGTEAIEWIVLKYDSETGRSLLISRYGLDAHYYHNTKPYPTWEKSDIRAWLNSTFLNAAFTSEEQKGIATTKVSTPSYNGNSGGLDTQDKLWLLSRDEATTYFTSAEARKCIPTAYAVKNGAWQYSGSDSSYKLNGTGCCWWWLRSPGYGSNYASFVNHGGSLDGLSVSNTDGCVRPAFWINLFSAAID